MIKKDCRFFYIYDSGDYMLDKCKRDGLDILCEPYKNCSNKILSDFLINKVWADYDLGSEESNLLEAVIDRLKETP